MKKIWIKKLLDRGLLLIPEWILIDWWNHQSEYSDCSEDTIYNMDDDEHKEGYNMASDFNTSHEYYYREGMYIHSLKNPLSHIDPDILAEYVVDHYTELDFTEYIDEWIEEYERSEVVPF